MTLKKKKKRGKTEMGAGNNRKIKYGPRPHRFRVCRVTDTGLQTRYTGIKKKTYIYKV